MKHHDFLIEFLPKIRNEISLIDKYLSDIESATFDLMSLESISSVHGEVTEKLQQIDLSRQSLQAVAQILDVLVAPDAQTSNNISSKIQSVIMLEAMAGRLLDLDLKTTRGAGSVVVFD